MAVKTKKAEDRIRNLDVFNIHKVKKYQTIVSYVWNRGNSATCADIVRDLRLSNANVFPAVDYLIRAGMLENIEDDAKGRRPRQLRICGRQCFAVGISLWANLRKADIVIMDAARQVVAETEVVDMSRNLREALKQVLAGTRALVKRNKLAQGHLAGIGVTLPGIIDCIRGVACLSNGFDSGMDVAIPEFFENAFRRPCLMQGNATTLALMEKKWGNAAPFQNFLYFTGLGLGMCINGQLYSGYQGCGGEIGFMKFCDDNTVDADGRAGTFNKVSPFRTIGMRLQEAVNSGARTIATERMRAGHELTVSVVIECAVAGDELCRELIAEGFQVMAEMIVGLNYLFNPEAIFLLPWTAQCADVSLDIVRRRLNLCKVINPSANVKVMAAKYGREDLARGIAMLPMDRLFALDNNNFVRSATNA